MHRDGKSIGLVPTMGYLHEGHISLVKKSKEYTDVTIVSIFVNPTQFAPDEDLTIYPQDIKHDISLLEKEDVEYLFNPNAKEIYNPDFQTYVNVGETTKILEGEFRPDHFKGVTTIVSILFNCIKPNFAFFGQKDAQQSIVIKRMTKDLKFDTEIIVCPIVRESDGLAMSSRNVYLSEQERKDALVLYKSLNFAAKLIEEGECITKNIVHKMLELIAQIPSSKLDYVSIVDSNNFNKIDHMEKGKEYFVLIACKIGKTRLIDNLLIKI